MGQCVQEIFAVDTDLIGDGALEESPKPNSKDSIAKESLKPKQSEPKSTVEKFAKGLMKTSFSGDSCPRESREL